MPRKIKYRFRDAILNTLKGHSDPQSLTSIVKQVAGKQAAESHHMLKLVDHELRHLVKERELERLSGGLFRIRPPKVRPDPAPREAETRPSNPPLRGPGRFLERLRQAENTEGRKDFRQDRRQSDRRQADRRQSGGRSNEPRTAHNHREHREMKRAEAPRQRPKGPTTNTIEGTISKNQRGFAFLKPSRPIPGLDEDVFLPPEEAEQLMSGDRVEVRLQKDPRGRGVIGSVTKILQRGLERFVARYVPASSHTAPYAEVETKDHQMKIFLERDPVYADLLEGTAVMVELIRAPEGRLAGRGKIIAKLADSLNSTTDDPFIIARHKLREFFPDDVMSEADQIPNELRPEDYQGRKDLRSLPFVTIDGADSRDFDDAVCAEKLKNGHTRLWVAVADVAHYVRPGSAMDLEAYTRATSIYFPHRVLPMLPERLSNGICSLNPNVDRLVLVAEMDFDQEGAKRSHKVYEAVFQSHHRCVYESLQEFYDKPAAPHPYSEKVVPSLQALHHLYKLVKAQRSSRGSVELELPEAKVIVNRETGEVDNIKVIERVDTHKLIEEFMIAANEAVSEIMIEAKKPFLFRVHEVPEEEAVIKFVEVASTMGAPIDHRWLQEIEPRSYQKLVEAIRPSPSVRVLNFLLLRSMKQAIYSHENLKHFGLASQAYTHFTSPIRRYPDLIVHRLLKAWLHRDEAATRAAPGSVAQDLEEAAHHCSQRERAAVDAERELLKMKQVRHAEKHLGEEHEGVITGVAAKGLFVELQSIFIEGFVPVDRLGNEMQFNDRALILKERGSNRLFRIGDRIKVQIARTNIHLLQIELEPLGHPAPQRGSKFQAGLTEPAPRPKKQKGHVVSPRPKGGKKGRRR